MPDTTAIHNYLLDCRHLTCTSVPHSWVVPFHDRLVSLEVPMLSPRKGLVLGLLFIA